MISQDDVIYFVFTDRFHAPGKNGSEPYHPNRFFGGNFEGIAQKAAYLAQLGITAVWISPVYVNIGIGETDPYHYYWALDFDRVDPHLYRKKKGYAMGDKRYLRDLVTTLQQHGIKTVLDMVVNHCGYGAREHFPADWFNTGEGDPTTEQSLAGLPDFNHDHPDVVDFFINNILDWIEATGIAGIRMDTAKHVEGRFWRAFKAQVKGRHHDITLIGEVLYQNKAEIAEIAKFQRDFDFDTMFDFPLCNGLINTLINDAPMTQLARPRLNDDEEKGVLDIDNPDTGGYTNASRLVTLLDNHDLEQRIMSHARQKHPGENGKTMAYQVVELCLTGLFTMRGIPSLYYGTEVGLEGWRDESGDAGLRRPFPWYLIDKKTNRPLPDTLEGRLWERTQSLISLCKNTPGVRYGNTYTLWSDATAYVFLRYFRDSLALCVFNNGYAAREWSVPVFRHANKQDQILPDRVMDLLEQNDLQEYTNPDDTVRLAGSALALRAPGKTAKVYVPDE